MMGSGKSTVGRLLSEATGWPRYDNDALLRDLYGLTPKEILEQRGEEALRAAEDATLAAGLDKPGPSIVDAAGGTILSEASRQLLRGVTVVWLRASSETLYMRALGAPHRPWLDDGGQKWVRDETARRNPLYGEAADIVVDTDGPDPAQTSAGILTRLAEFCPELH
jgi:shikimate kinase